MSISQVPLSRRRFIVGAGALVIGAYLPSTGALARSNAPAASGAAAFDANAFVQIGADGVVTVISKHTEVGQESIPAWRRWSPKSSMPTGRRYGSSPRRWTPISTKPDLRIPWHRRFQLGGQCL